MSSITDVLSNQASWHIAVGDVLDVLGGIPDSVFHCSVSSPPYWGLRNYLGDDHLDKAKELGSEETPEKFVEKMVEVYREVRRVLRDDGVCWVNIGDSYATGGGRVGERPGGGKQGDDWIRKAKMTPVNRMPIVNLKPGDMIGIPWRLALALQADGWFLRMDVIWQKKSPMPESLNGWRWEKCRVKVKGTGWGEDDIHPSRRLDGKTKRVANVQGVSTEGVAKFSDCPGCPKCSSNDGLVLRKGSWRPTKGHEYILQLAKSPQYFCDAQAVAKAVTSGAHGRGDDISTRNPRSVWTFSTEPAAWDFCLACKTLYQGSARSTIKTKKTRGNRSVRICTICKSTDGWVDHFATFPSALPEKCILASTSEKGCCPECGSQYARIIEKKRKATRPAEKNAIDTTGKANRDPERHVTETVTVGWRPTCNCDTLRRRIPPLVLDPFSGSGRTIQIARRLGCRAIGIELNPAYAALSEALINEDLPLFN